MGAAEGCVKGGVRYIETVVVDGLRDVDVGGGEKATWTDEEVPR